MRPGGQGAEDLWAPDPNTGGGEDPMTSINVVGTMLKPLGHGAGRGPATVVFPRRGLY